MKLKVLGWSPSRYAKYKECPAKVKYEDLMKLCPVCFKGKISGGFDGEPVVCDTCDGEQPVREALDRGNKLDAALTLHVQQPTSVAKTHEKLVKIDKVQHAEDLAEAVRHPAIAKLVKALRKQKNILPQESIVLDSKWNRVSQFTKNAWGRLKLDVLRLTPKIAHVIDWKSGNIDKRTNQIRERDEYHESMRMYQAAVLSAYPQAECTAVMAFIDAPPKLDNPFKEPRTGTLKRKDLERVKQEIEKKLEPMFADEQFAPRPGMYCNWCPYSGSRKKGGPCPH